MDRQPDAATRAVMRIQIASDLHREFPDSHPVPDLVPGADVAVMAGDLSIYARWHGAADEMCLMWRDARIVYLPGNHEFYGSDFARVRKKLRGFCQRRGIEYLDRRSVLIGGVRFVGATLWTDFQINGTPKASRERIGRAINDFQLIRWGDRMFDTYDASERHAGDVAFIETELDAANAAGETAVVVTHHLPSPACIAPVYRNDPLNPAFVSDLDAIILKHKPGLWIHGHTHHSIDARVGDTRILCNPGGYVRGDNPLFDPFCTVVV